MKKNSLIVSLVIILIVFLIGGCRMKAKETLTKRQQDNVVRGIARNYDIKSIKFTKINRDSKTGSYHLLFIINNHEKYKTGITVSKISEFDEKLDNIGLSPIDDFKFIERDKPINNTDNILKTIEITYLGE